jgi:type I restriction enzyme S subunit
MYGSTHKTIYMHDLLPLRTPLPPCAEQQAAVKVLDRLSEAHRAATAGARDMRARLDEYRDALITEAVTGQIDVSAMSDRQMDERLHSAIEGPAP